MTDAMVQAANAVLKAIPSTKPEEAVTRQKIVKATPGLDADLRGRALCRLIDTGYVECVWRGGKPFYKQTTVGVVLDSTGTRRIA